MPESNPLGARTPPRPPAAPPVTGPAGGQPSSGRFFAIRVQRALILGLIVMGLVAWLVTLPGVAGALTCGLSFSLITRRFKFVRVPILATVAASIAGAIAGSVFLGQGSLLLRLLSAFLASLAVAPWLVVLGFALWARSYVPPRASA